MPTPEGFFGCIFDIHGDNHDARLLLDEVGPISPGDSKKAVPVKFLCADLVMPKLSLGDKLFLKEGNVIGEARVVRIINTNPESSEV